MSVYIGSKNVNQIIIGGKEIESIYIGDKIVFSNSQNYSENTENESN